MIRRKNGISLIILVVTVVLMAVIAGVIVISLSDSDVIDEAEKAKAKVDLSTAKEIVLTLKTKWEINDEMVMEENNVTSFKEYATLELFNAGFNVASETGGIEVSEDGEYIYIYPVVPKGFTVSIYEGEKTIDGGLVIYKTTAETLKNTDHETAMKSFDQFVWVPVPNFITFVRSNWKNNKPIYNLEEIYTEPFSQITAQNDPTGEFAEYNAMRESVEKNGGFYIARYEAGSTSSRGAEHIGTTDVLLRKGVDPYWRVGWAPTMKNVSGTITNQYSEKIGEGAVSLSRKIHTGTDSQSHLIYGVQWDATLRWLSDKYNVTDSSSWGNYKDSTGNAAKDAGTLRTTGYSEAWKTKNIYDLAGNVSEWTMEAKYSTLRVRRGGIYAQSGAEHSASERHAEKTIYSQQYISFRPAMYIK